MPSAISCPLWSPVYECQRVYVHISGNDSVWYVCDVLYAVLFVRVNCAVSTRFINVCNGYVFSVVNMYLDHSVLCVLMVECMSVVVYVMSLY